MNRFHNESNEIQFDFEKNEVLNIQFYFWYEVAYKFAIFFFPKYQLFCFLQCFVKSLDPIYFGKTNWKILQTLLVYGMTILSHFQRLRSQISIFFWRDVNIEKKTFLALYLYGIFRSNIEKVCVSLLLFCFSKFCE